MNAPGQTILLLLTFLPFGCAKEAKVSNGLPGYVGVAGPDTAAGVVRQVGSTPFTRTILQAESEAVSVVGPFQLEITRLTGATVRASGELMSESPFGPELRVSAYEIESVDGERPHVGTLGRDEDGLYVRKREGQDLRLGVAPARFDSLLGGRVWVITDEQRTVLRYGVLRKPEEMKTGATP